MKYLLLFWSEALPEGTEHADGFGTEADYQAWADFGARLTADGSYVDSGDLEPPTPDRLVRPDLAADREIASPGPGAVQVSGYSVVEVADEAAARTIAASVPLYGTVEVRPVVDYGAWD